MVHVLSTVSVVAFFVWLVADNAIVFSKARHDARRADRLFLLVLVAATWAGLVADFTLAANGVGAPARGAEALQLAGLAVLLAGAAFRWTAIFQFGRFHMPALGEAYAEYRRRTHRLIPGVF